MIETSDLLTGAISQALETMAFLTIVPLEEDLAIPENPVLAEISFTGPKSGTIQILAGLDFGKILAENIGALDEADDQSAADALRELCNVACGLVLAKIASSREDVFDVSVPAVKSGDNSVKWQEFAGHPNNCVLNIEGYMVATRLVIEG